MAAKAGSAPAAGADAALAAGAAATTGVCCAMQPEAAIATALTKRKTLFDKKTAFAGQIAGINNVCSSNYRSSPCHLFPVPCSLFFRTG